MKKALSLIVAASAATTIASADARNFGGATAGISVGHVATKAEAKTGAVAIPGAGLGVNPLLSNKTTDLNASGFTGGLFVGYSKQFDNHFVAGLEAHASFANNRAKFLDEKKFEARETFGVDAQFGRVFENVLPYITLGWANTKFKVGTKSRRSTAFVAGLGLKTLLTEHVTLGAEWKHGMFKAVKDESEAVNAKVKPRTSDFRVKLAYKW